MLTIHFYFPRKKPTSNPGWASDLSPNHTHAHSEKKAKSEATVHLRVSSDANPTLSPARRAPPGRPIVRSPNPIRAQRLARKAKVTLLLISIPLANATVWYLDWNSMLFPSLSLVILQFCKCWNRFSKFCLHVIFINVYSRFIICKLIQVILGLIIWMWRRDVRVL